MALLHEFLTEETPSNPQLNSVSTDAGLTFKDMERLSSDSELEDILHPDPMSDADDPN